MRLITVDGSIPGSTSLATLGSIPVTEKYIVGYCLRNFDAAALLAGVRVSLAGGPVIPAMGSTSQFLHAAPNGVWVPLVVPIQGPGDKILVEGTNTDAATAHAFALDLLLDDYSPAEMWQVVHSVNALIRALEEERKKEA